MTFDITLEDEGFVRSRVDHKPYIDVINMAKESGKVAAFNVPTPEAAKTVSTLRNCASALDIGLRFDNLVENADGTTRIRFRTAAKRAYSPEAAAKRKATMLKNGTTAGRKAKTGTTAKSGKGAAA